MRNFMDPKDFDPEELKKELEKEKKELRELKERIIQIKKNKDQQRKREKEEQKKKEAKKKKQREILKNLPPPPSSTQKILIRVLFSAILILGLGLFIFWGSQKKENIKNWLKSFSSSPQEVPSAEQQVKTEKEEKEPEPQKPEEELIPPSPLVEVDQTKIIEVSSTSQIPEALTQFFSQKLESGSRYQILVKNFPQKEWVSLIGILEGLQIKTPPEFIPSLEEQEFTLLLFSQSSGNRLGLISKVKSDQNLDLIMNSWEPTMERDLHPFFSVMEVEEATSASSFKSGEYQGSEFRYINFDLPELGICYGIIEPYLILSTSGQSMVESINYLQTL